MRWLAILLLSACAVAECQPVTLQKGEGVDWNCRLFRRVTRNGVLYIERLRPDRTVIALEAVDCSRAVPEDGVLLYHTHVIVGEVYCGPTPDHGRKHHAIDSKLQ